MTEVESSFGERVMNLSPENRDLMIRLIDQLLLLPQDQQGCPRGVDASRPIAEIGGHQHSSPSSKSQVGGIQTGER